MRALMSSLGSWQKGRDSFLGSSRNQMEGTSLVVQWLRICLPMQGAWIRYGELRSHLPQDN